MSATIHYLPVYLPAPRKISGGEKGRLIQSLGQNPYPALSANPLRGALQAVSTMVEVDTPIDIPAPPQAFTLRLKKPRSTAGLRLKLWLLKAIRRALFGQGGR